MRAWKYVTAPQRVSAPLALHRAAGHLRHHRPTPLPPVGDLPGGGGEKGDPARTVREGAGPRARVPEPGPGGAESLTHILVERVGGEERHGGAGQGALWAGAGSGLRSAPPRQGAVAEPPPPEPEPAPRGMLGNHAAARRAACPPACPTGSAPMPRDWDHSPTTFLPQSNRGACPARTGLAGRDLRPVGAKAPQAAWGQLRPR